MQYKEGKQKKQTNKQKTSCTVLSLLEMEDLSRSVSINPREEIKSSQIIISKALNPIADLI